MKHSRLHCYFVDQCHSFQFSITRCQMITPAKLAVTAGHDGSAMWDWVKCNTEEYFVLKSEVKQCKSAQSGTKASHTIPHKSNAVGCRALHLWLSAGLHQASIQEPTAKSCRSLQFTVTRHQRASHASLLRLQDILLMVGPFGDWVKYNIEEHTVLVSECDGVRLISAQQHELLSRVPDSQVDVFRIGSTAPGNTCVTFCWLCGMLICLFSAACTRCCS